MSEDKHTPGPWETTERPYIVKDDEGDIFSGGDWYIYPPLGESGPVALASSQANAHLIVAAPDLLTVAKRYEAWEAKLIRADDAWNSENGLPALNQELYDELMEIQTLRNTALEKAGVAP